MSAFAFSRAIGPVPIQCVIREKHESDLEITQVPVEAGADITDHAFRLPSKLSLDLADEGGAATWQALKAFQATRLPFNIVTGLDVYSSMLIQHLEGERTDQYGRIYYGRVDIQEVIIVNSATAADEGGADRKHGEPGGAKSSRSAKPSSQRAKGATTQRRASGKTARGGGKATPQATPRNPATGVPQKRTPAANQSILKKLAG